jgi:glycolate oxidase
VGPLAGELVRLLGAERVLSGERIVDDDCHDESLTAAWVRPDLVALPETTAEVAEVVRLARVAAVPVTTRGSGTGLSGGCVPRPGGVVIAMRRMTRVLEIDEENMVAVVQPGATLERLEAETAARGLVYPVFPGEMGGSLGGNVATNAGGMRAVKYGVTRHHVLGLEAVLGTGEVIRTGGRFVKSTSGYDLTQLIVGSEGTLAVVTEAILRLHPRIAHATTILAPFPTIARISAVVPRLVRCGLSPAVLEYIDRMAMAGLVVNAGLDLGVPETIREAALAYLVVVLEDDDAGHLEAAVERLGGLLLAEGALDVFVLPGRDAETLIRARERMFWAAKAAGADDIVDTVVPRAQLPAFLARVVEVAAQSGALVTGCGHAGDGNVHLSVFEKDPDRRRALLRSIYAEAAHLGGAISGEHGIGTEKRGHFLELEQPEKLALLRRIKAAFDPDGILNPGVILPVEPAVAVGPA